MMKQSSSAKLDEVKREVEELTSAWTLSECTTEDVAEDSLHELMKNVISTLEELDSKLDEVQVHVTITQTLKHVISTAASSASVFRSNEDNELNDSDTAIIGKDDQSLLFNQSESVLNSTLANTSIDYEKDERIQRLELENNRVRDREIVLQYEVYILSRHKGPGSLMLLNFQ
ncbi:hypothetical protein KIN20_029627 [Parelaphostrongylus tenuis]|uniref:Uncharacterized protein n=1 Tax=Parelaphostrongylus tenuis TaxID=148309 RepID=A0AAD5R2S7_PARTN|nr:hypothetical protein KIN20_029627 [Parelaphostrongylus tenuis]